MDYKSYIHVMGHKNEYYRVGKLDVEYARDSENIFIFGLLIQILASFCW